MKDPRELWQSNVVPVRVPSPAEAARKAKSFRRSIWWRNAREYAGGALAIFLLGRHAWHARGWMTLAAMAFGVTVIVYVVVTLHRRGAAGPAPHDGAPTSHTLRALRGELERQRVLLASVWRWCVAPIFVGIVVGRTALEIDSGQPDWPGTARYFVFVVGFCLFVAWLNRWGARKIAEEIRAIDDGGDRQ